MALVSRRRRAQASAPAQQHTRPLARGGSLQARHSDKLVARILPEAFDANLRSKRSPKLCSLLCLPACRRNERRTSKRPEDHHHHQQQNQQNQQPSVIRCQASRTSSDDDTTVQLCKYCAIGAGATRQHAKRNYELEFFTLFLPISSSWNTKSDAPTSVYKTTE